MTREKFLKKAYSHGGAEEATAFYDEWANTYDGELTESGYVTPDRCARALAEACETLDAPVLDLGCGTGLSGRALVKQGFTTIDGWDPSSQMLRRAETRHVYRVLRQIEPEAALHFRDGAYGAVNVAGALGPSLAPPETFDQVLDCLPSGGLMSFSLNDHAIAEGSHVNRLTSLAESGAAEIVFKEYGEHIPATGLKAWIYVIRKP